VTDVPPDWQRYAGDLAALGGVRAVVLDDGAGRGMRVLEFRTGAGLRFEVLVDRAMDIGVAEFDDRSVGWRSPTGFRHPAFHENADEDGLAWLRSFSGLLVTGGLDHTLSPREVSGNRYRYPGRERIRHGLHGRIANVPARLIGYGEDWRDGRCVLWAEGECRQVAVFGEHLVLRRRIEADLGGTEIRLHDTVTNAGFEPAPHRFLYHVNLGWPFLDEGTEVVSRLREMVWCNDPDAAGQGEHLRIGGPVDGATESAYQLALEPDDDGRTRVRVVNEKLATSFEVDYRQDQFPAFIQWVNRRAGAYAIALEPMTHGVDPDPEPGSEQAFVLSHAEQRTYATVFRFSRL
jgi:galactose mutarotase-like enzyme